jgi:hypothetical protein
MIFKKITQPVVKVSSVTSVSAHKDNIAPVQSAGVIYGFKIWQKPR